MKRLRALELALRCRRFSGLLALLAVPCIAPALNR
jgi:hypothetical protein